MRSLLGTSVLAAAPKVIYAFAPPGGWVLEDIYVRFRHQMAYASRIPEHILFGKPGSQRVRQYLTLSEVERDFGPITFLKARLETMDPKLVQVLRAKCDEEWFL